MGDKHTASMPSTSTSLAMPTGQNINSATNNGHTSLSVGFQPGSFSQEQLNQLAPLLQTASSAAANLPTSFNYNDVLSNPYVHQYYNAANNVLQNQYTQQMNQLSNDLNAHNQLGSSYDALQHYNAQQGLQNQQNQAYGNALNNGLNAYQMSYQEPLSVLSGAQNAYLNGINALYQPMGYGTQYQSSVSLPAQNAANNYQLNQQQQQNSILGSLLSAGSSLGGTAAGMYGLNALLGAGLAPVTGGASLAMAGLPA